MLKKISVSSALPTRVEVNGARHHAPERSRSKIWTSSIWAIRNAEPDPTATLSVTAGKV